MIYRQHKPFKLAGGVMRIADVEVDVDLLENDNVQPDSRIPFNVQIANTSQTRDFHEIRIRLNEVHSWSSLVGSSTQGDRGIMTEITKLTKKNLHSWIENIDHNGRRVICLNNMSLDIPKTTSCDRNSGLIRVHHVLEVKLISHGYSVDNMRFRFPFVIGGKQYDQALPQRHAVTYLHVRHAEEVLADTIAAVVSGITKSAQSWLVEEDHPDPEPEPTGKRSVLLRQEQLIRSTSLSDSEQLLPTTTSRPELLRQERLVRCVST
eukprot:CAMPEP_0119013466 /NCGR_PEP_ID=MMETSP1176-20130426/8464_1 /TAXON_ID=265551 /ORGANISM="Synedropsis recta cf, Strain CCMP1620" /LENGTH=263 /DNA_ID=CAMNT_0006966557 /DNA_START=55 /DNA_END=846 /DNA_ORIENTATION=+